MTLVQSEVQVHHKQKQSDATVPVQRPGQNWIGNSDLNNIYLLPPSSQDFILN